MERTVTAHHDSKLDKLVQPVGGLFKQVFDLTTHPGEPAFPVFSAALGDVRHSIDSVARYWVSKTRTEAIDGAGGGLNAKEARIRALAEGLERYSTCFYDERQFIWASANELGAEALDLDSLPRLSDTEYAHPKSFLVKPDKTVAMRWVRGVSLLDGRAVWVPAVLVYLKIPYMSRGEQICLPISTGCAAHTSFEQALSGAICEVMERDAISLVWLQKMQLPQIELKMLNPELESYFEINNRSSGIKQLFFDATTDLGIPTIYCLQFSPHNDRLATLVACNTDLNPVRSVGKILRELASSRIGLQVERQSVANWDDFLDVFDGAVFMGKPEQLPAYDFLVNTPHHRQLEDLPNLATGDPTQDLQLLLARLRAHKLEAFAVDLTTDEALRVGMRVVRVIIPGLQPLSFSYRARFLGHPRLYDAPARMGYRVHPEAEINIWPQPFA
jgi:ribosomal protein S12 methylthiotransferase accessory factor